MVPRPFYQVYFMTNQRINDKIHLCHFVSIGKSFRLIPQPGQKFRRYVFRFRFLGCQKLNRKKISDPLAEKHQCKFINALLSQEISHLIRCVQSFKEAFRRELIHSGIRTPDIVKSRARIADSERAPEISQTKEKITVFGYPVRAIPDAVC